MITKRICLKMPCKIQLVLWPGITRAISLLVFQGASRRTSYEESQIVPSGGVLLKYSGRIGEVSL